MDRKLMNLMLMKRVCFVGEVCSGKGAISRLCSLPEGKAVLLSGAFAERSGFLSRVAAQLEKAGLQTTTVLAEKGEPTLAMIEKHQERISAAQPDWFIVVGGGSLLDFGKLAWVLYEHPGFEFSGRAVVPKLRAKSRLVAIPTTAGSGSEASQAAVLLDASAHRKIPLVSTEWLPDLVILDPELTVSLPAPVTVSTGFDAVTHAVEASVSTFSHPFVRALAASAVRILIDALPRVLEHPQDLEARENMLIAAHLAGLAQSFASTGLAHALAHAVTAHFGTAHACATSFFLERTMALHASKTPGIYSQLASDAGFHSESALIDCLRALSHAGTAKSLAELTRTPLGCDELSKLAKSASQDVCIKTNCCKLTPAEIESFLASV
jgi:alcohol dehydrogenase class IV